VSVTPNIPEPSNARERPQASRRPYLRLAAALVLVAVFAASAFVLWQWTQDDDGLKARQQAVAERGAVVMPFDLDATTHVFAPTGDGGVQTVVADDSADEEQIALIRSHLQDEVGAFRQGDFGDPATIHGHDMPGLTVLESSADRLTITFREVPAGGEVTYSSDDPVVVQALHDWFQAQLMDHGEHAQGR